MPEKTAQRHSGSWAIQMSLIIFMTIVVFYGDLQNSNESIIERTNKYPIYLVFFIIPLVVFIYTIIRKNTFPGLIQWMLNNFFKYLTMFVSLVITTYVVYYVFIIGNPQTWFDWVITVVIISSIFVLFLWMKYFEESSNVKLDAQVLKIRMKALGLFISLFLLTMAGSCFI